MKRSRQKRGRFITLEGLEGVGKSTQLEFIYGYLKKKGVNWIVKTREPGGTPEADELRNTLLKVRNPGTDFDPIAELLVMFAARSFHVRTINPLLEDGAWVLCDRFVDASYAYQGGGRGISSSYIRSLERMVLKGLKPDLTLLFDAPLEVGIARTRSRGELDRFEQERKPFFERVRKIYLARARREPRRIKLIDASQSIEDVQTDIAALLDRRLSSWL